MAGLREIQNRIQVLQDTRRSRTRVPDIFDEIKKPEKELAETGRIS